MNDYQVKYTAKKRSGKTVTDIFTVTALSAYDALKAFDNYCYDRNISIVYSRELVQL